MAVTYVTAAKVAAFLGFNQPTGFDGTTQPTQTQVEDIINEMEDLIDNETFHSWRSTTVSNEYHEIELPYTRTTGIPIYLSHRFIKEPLASGSDDKLEVYEGDEPWNDWLTDTSKIEGRDQDYWLNYEEGILYLRSWVRYPTGARLTYRYGEATVPLDIQNACKKLSAAEIIQADDRSIIVPEGADNIPLPDKATKWREEAMQILKRYTELRIPTK